MTKGTAAARGGLRERKKQHTRETIARAAVDLFDRQGFQRTTIPEIAAAADVSPRTVSSYFPAKEDLAFLDTAETFERLEQRLGDRLPGETTADALRAWIGQSVPDWEERGDELRALRRVIDADEALLAYEKRYMAHGERLIAEAMARDLGASPQDLEPRMAAAATIALFDVLDEHHDRPSLRSGEGGDACTGVRVRNEEILGLLDRALLFIGAGIRALQEEPGGEAAAPDAGVVAGATIATDAAATSRAPEPTTR